MVPLEPSTEIEPEGEWRLLSNSYRSEIMMMFVPMFAAAGYAFLYLLLGGGLGGALLIFIFAKMLGK